MYRRSILDDKGNYFKIIGVHFLRSVQNVSYRGGLMYPDTCNVSDKGKKMISIDASFLQLRTKKYKTGWI